MFSYPCPACSQRLHATRDRIGTRTICPKCLRPVVVPRLDPEDDDVGGPMVDLGAPPPSRHDPRDDTDTPDSFAGVPVTPPPAAANGSGRPARVTAPLPQRPAPVPVQAPAPAPVPAPTAVARVTTTPPPAAVQPVAAPAVAPGRVILNPTGDMGVDLAAELTAAISMRMKPPPEPQSDLKLTSWVWLVLTIIAGCLWAVGVLYDEATLPFVALIGLVFIAFGSLWAVYQAGQRDWVRGLITALPPILLWQLAQSAGVNKHRPLRFVLTGMLLVGLFWIAKDARSAVQPVFAALEPTPVPVPPPATPLEKLKVAADRKQPEILVTQLRELAQPDAVRDEASGAKEPFVAELKRLAGSARDDVPAAVRAAAVAALATWAPDAARGPVLAALRGPDSTERRSALTLAPRWKDDEVAAAVAARLTDREDGPEARDTLLKIGPPAAENALAAVARTTNPDAQLLVLTVLDLLDKLNGPRTAALLKELSETSPLTEVRKDAARRLADRTGGK